MYYNGHVQHFLGCIEQTPTLLSLGPSFSWALFNNSDVLLMHIECVQWIWHGYRNIDWKDWFQWFIIKITTTSQKYEYLGLNMNIHTFLLAERYVVYMKFRFHPEWQYFLCHSLHGDQSSILLHRRHTGMAYYIYCKGSNFCCSALFSTRACLGYSTLPAIVMRIFCCAHLGEILTTTVYGLIPYLHTIPLPKTAVSKKKHNISVSVVCWFC